MARAGTAGTAAPPMLRVWDPLVRITHWTTALGFFIAYFSEDALTLHVWAGYVVGILLVLRTVWGFIGPRHARFVDFLYRPGEVFAYLRDLTTFRGRRYLGHSPAGGAMAMVLWFGMAVIVGSGLVLYAIEENAGPLAGVVGPSVAAPEIGESSVAGEDEEHEREGAGNGELWEEVHEILANLTLILVLAHIAGVLLASYVHQENLTRAMITGQKRPLDE
jgi:cytochrome b